MSRAFLAGHRRPNSANILLSAQGPRRANSKSLAHSGQPDDIVVKGKYAYVVEGSGTTNAFEIFNISMVLPPPDNL